MASGIIKGIVLGLFFMMFFVTALFAGFQISILSYILIEGLILLGLIFFWKLGGY